jgi:hypothetical protein
MQLQNFVGAASPRSFSFVTFASLGYFTENLVILIDLQVVSFALFATGFCFRHIQAGRLFKSKNKGFIPFHFPDFYGCLQDHEEGCAINLGLQRAPAGV